MCRVIFALVIGVGCLFGNDICSDNITQGIIEDINNGLKHNALGYYENIGNIICDDNEVIFTRHSYNKEKFSKQETLKRYCSSPIFKFYREMFPKARFIDYTSSLYKVQEFVIVGCPKQ